MATTIPTTLKPVRASTTKKKTIRTKEASFGNGYKQRYNDGINTTNCEMSVRWVGSPTDISALETHFEERDGYQTFTINDTWVENTAWKWTCTDWSREYLGHNTDALTATLRREFDLA